MRVLQTFPTANDQETIAAPVQRRRRRRQSNFVLLPRGRKEGMKELPRDDFGTLPIGDRDIVN